MINTLNAALDRGPNTTGHLDGDEELAARRSALPSRASKYFTLVQHVRRRHAHAAREQGRRRSKPSRDPAAERLQGDHRGPRHRGHALPVTQAGFRARDEGCRADAALEGVSHARLSATYSPNKQADFPAALADAKAVINSGHVFARAGVRRPVVRRARGRSGPRRLLREHRLQRNRKEFIFTVQFSYDLHDATTSTARRSTTICTSSTCGQYDNAASGVGIAARPEQRPSLPPADADAVRA